MFWGRNADIVNQSGSMEVRVLEVSQEVGRSPQRYKISHTWQDTFEINRFQSGSVAGLHLFKLGNLCIEVSSNHFDVRRPVKLVIKFDSKVR